MDIKRFGGNGLTWGCILLACTMMLHPSGGNMAHLQRIAAINATAHSIGLVGIIFLYVGFVALRDYFLQSPTLSLAALTTMIVGLSAGFMAAVVNGITLPIFITQVSDGSYDMNLVRIVLRYGTSLNHAFDFVMEGAVIFSMGCWSALILKSGTIPRYAGYVGIFNVILFTASLLANFVLVDLHGFRLFILGFIVWILVVNYAVQTKAGSTVPEK